MERTILSTRRDRGIREKNKTQRGSDITSRRTRECKKCSGITSNFHWSRLNGYRTCGGRFHTVIGFDRYCRYAIYIATESGGIDDFHLRFHGKTLTLCIFPSLLLLVALAFVSLLLFTFPNQACHKFLIVKFHNF